MYKRSMMANVECDGICTLTKHENVTILQWDSLCMRQQKHQYLSKQALKHNHV